MSGPVAALLVMSAGAALAWVPGVRLPRGPLFRVEGSQLSVFCNVSALDEASGLDFEWTLIRRSEPPVRLRLVSTRDPAFAHASIRHRVLSTEVAVRRPAPGSVQLLIGKVRKSDEGDLECSVPAAEGRYRAEYTALVQLKVVPDTLQLTGPDAVEPLTLHQGQSLALHCAVASSSPLHLHVAVSFVLQEAAAGRRQPVVGLDRDLALDVDTGGPFWLRFTRGEVGLQKFGANSYHLYVQHVEMQDAGRYECVAAQWLQDPDGSWQKILEKSVPLVELSVQPNELAVRAEVSVAPAMFYRGDTVALLCNGSLGAPLEEGQLSVGWWGPPGQRLLASVDRRGVRAAGDERTAVGTELSVDRPGQLCFRLRLHGARRQDQGLYRCQLALWARSQDGHWYQAADASSSPTTLFLYLTVSDTLTLPAVVGVVTSLSVSIAIVAGVTCCFLRRLSKRRNAQ
ncbi:LOW QUALITY PROTEIN: immunoglobulin superfamily member 8 [Leucoraja erinacea]|uniref:LOW QUALITY PROTEIN: immunoglobulin superfamily member 8 n=1 Tax=Leucoraja erinaceus TaxID=7782 RepID=UPI002456F5D8|nr:LOW QUALITY PROTEIN: immunoglobulin superfamily member 8 [Leucoraja erinacea]